MDDYFGTAAGERGGRFDRAWLNAEFDDALNRGNGGRLFGLRRVGKSTEALACIQRQKADPAVTAIHLNAEGFGNEGNLLLALLKALPAKGWLERVTAAIGADNAISKTVREGLQKLTGSPADLQAYFGPISECIERVLVHSERVVLVVDEFPWLARSILEADPSHGRARVNQLLATMRRWRGSGQGMRMLLVGSIGMAALGRRHGLDLSHLSDLGFLEVPPLDEAEAPAFVTSLAAGSRVQGWSAGHAPLLLAESAAWYPAILQAGFQAMTVGGRAVALGKVPDLFADKVRPNLDQIFFAQFDRRLQLYRELPAPMPVLLRRALAFVLSAADRKLDYPELQEQLAAVVAELDDADLGDALAILREDGFLSLRAPRNAPQQWRAASGLVSAWWSQRRGNI